MRVNRVKNKGITIPPEILAFEVIRNAKITQDEEKLVMTGVDYNKKENMYKEALSREV